MQISRSHGLIAVLDADSSAALALFGAVMGLTARTRWKKRQQKLMRRNFAAFGEKYRQEDEEIRY